MSDPTAQRVELRLPSGETLVVDWIAPTRGEDCAVFVHGLGSHRRGDKALYFGPRFAGLGWGFLSVDLRGHGESGGSMEGLTLSHCIEDLQAALAWLPKPAAARLLIGSSMGGAVTAWFNQRHPAPGRLLAWIAPSLRFPGRFAEGPPAELDAWRSTGTRRFQSEWIDLRIGYGLVEDAGRYPFAELLKTHRAPTLILHGLQDTAVPWRDSVDFLDQSPSKDLDLLLIKEGDHRLTAHKALLFDTMEAWLRQRGVLALPDTSDSRPA